MNLPCDDDSTISLTIDLSRRRFEELARDLLERTGRCVAKSLSDAGIDKDRVSDVILVGGSTRMPMVRSYLEEIFDRPPNTSVDPMLAVALGTAVQASLVEEEPGLESILVTDVSPFTLGVAVVGDHAGETRAGVFDPLIHRNASLPAKCTKRFHTMHPQQDTVCIEVFQGDDPIVENNVFLDKYFLGGIPTQTGQPEAIEITFEYDTDGILHVSAIVCATGKSAGIRIDSTEKHGGTGIAAARATVESFWDRSLPARVLAEIIAKIEADVDSLPDEKRERVLALIREAHTALRSQSREDIERCTAELRLVAPEGSTDEH